MKFVQHDGGRAAAGFKAARVGDCVTRAIAIATEQPYQTVYDAINERAKRHNARRRKSSARDGVWRHIYQPYLESLGWSWIPTMSIGSGARVHLNAEELPGGRLIVRVSKHVCAVIDGVLHDTSHQSRDGKRCVYGYFRKPRIAEPPDSSDPQYIVGAAAVPADRMAVLFDELLDHLGLEIIEHEGVWPARSWFELRKVKTEGL